MTGRTNPECRILRLEAWPEQDRLAWSKNIAPADPFDLEMRYGAHLRPDSLKKLRKDYGRWLSFLASRGCLDAATPPLERITPGLLCAYFRGLIRAGNKPRTVVNRFGGLATAMKILAPGHDVSWIRRPSGVSVYKLLPASPRVLQVPPCEVLFDWGLRMMEGAPALQGRMAQLLAYRDGLLIAMLAERARRGKSMSLLTLDREVLQSDGHYRIELTHAQVKNKKPDRFDLSATLTPALDTYLAKVRPALLGEERHAALWVGQSGRPLTAKGLSHRIYALSRKRFGYAFGPHCFRHALSTMLAEAEPTNTGLAAAVLNITPAVNDQHYNRATQMHACRTYAELIDGRREAAAVAVRREVAAGAAWHARFGCKQPAISPSHDDDSDA